MTKNMGYKIILISASISVFPLIKVSPINTHMHCLLLAEVVFSLGSGSFLVPYYGSGPTKGWCVLFLGELPGSSP
jgi:hypothetical protein